MKLKNEKMYKKILSLLNLKAGSKVLDIEYGNGRMLKTMDEKFSPNLYGISLSEKTEKKAYRKNQRANKEKRLNLFSGEFSEMPFEDDFFDACVSINSIYHWNDVLKTLQEIRRCMKPGSIFYNAAYTKEWLETKSLGKDLKKFEAVELIVLGRKAGFEKVLVHEIVHRKSFVIACYKGKSD